jgi:hypothetical protein
MNDKKGFPKDGSFKSDGEKLPIKPTSNQAPPAKMSIKQNMTEAEETTVSEAIRAYEQLGEAIDVGYDSLIKAYGPQELYDGIPNSDYFHALCLTSIMFRRTLSTIRILSGFDLGPFIKALHKTFEEAVEKIKKTNEGFVRILLMQDGPEDQIKYLRDNASQYPAIIKVKKLIPGIIKPSHRTICDDDKLRLEEPHPPLIDGSDASLVRAKAYFGNTARAKAEAKYFDWMWEHLTTNL